MEQTSRRSRLRYLPWLPIPVFLALFLYFSGRETAGEFEPRLSLAVLNLVLLTGVSLVVAGLAGRSYLGGESVAVLFLGCGMAAFGLGAGFAGMVLALGHDADVGVTGHNLSACLAGACCLVSALVAARRIRLRHPPARTVGTLLLAFGAVALFVVLVVVADADGLLPPFFVPREGPTLVRQVVLGSAIAMFTLAALQFFALGRRSPTPFVSWYALGLAMIAIGLSAVFTQHAVGSPVSWVGRAGQYVGCLYMCVAVVSVPASARPWGIPVDRMLRETRDRHRTLVDYSPDAILVHADGVYLFANPAAVHLFRARSAADVVGRPVLDLVHPDDRESVRRRIETVRHGEPTPLREHRLMRLDGSDVIVESTGSACEFRGRPAVQVVMRDVSRRRAAEEALRIQSDMAVDLLRTTDARPICRLLAERIYSVAGGAMVTVSEFDPRTQSVTLRSLQCTPEERRQATAILGRDLEGISLAFRDEIRGRWIGGTLTPVPGLRALLFDQVPDAVCDRLVRDMAIGDVFGMPCSHEEDLLATVAVITHGRGPLRAQALIESLVAEAALALKRARADEQRREMEARALRLAEELRETDRRKDEFIAMLSHELRNPLAPIRYALPQVAGGELAEPARRALAVVSRQVDHLVRLVDDLLDVSRITRGRIELQRERVTLASVATQAIETAGPLIEAAGHDFRVELPAEPVWLDVDPHRVSQIVTNLLTNAAKYTPARGRITLEAACAGGDIVVRVRDTGVGIPGEIMPTLFEMFSQGRAEHAQGGLGIGLALSRRLAEMHGGSVQVESEGAGKGAEFVVRLPVVCAPPERIAEPPRSASTPGRHLKVLIVDDNEDLVEMLALLVTQLGHDARTALDGPRAVSEATAYRPDVVLLDVGLPGMSGLEVARTLRADPQMAGACLVALTGWGQPEDQRQTREAGFDRHLTKPTDPATLEDLLAQIAGAAAPHG